MPPSSAPPEHDLTTMLRAMQQGDAEAGSRVLALVYVELRRIAAAYLRRERSDHTLQPTALVHEAYLRLFGSAGVHPRDRTHFFALAAQQMRRILVDHARARCRVKRGGRKMRVSLTDLQPSVDARDEEVLAIHEALERLAAQDARAARIVELRFFAGLEEEEVADVIGVSVGTVKRDWRFARSWLLVQLRPMATLEGAGPSH